MHFWWETNTTQIAKPLISFLLPFGSASFPPAALLPADISAPPLILSLSTHILRTITYTRLCCILLFSSPLFFLPTTNTKYPSTAFLTESTKTMTAQLIDKSAIQIRPYNKDDRDQVISILLSGFKPVGTRMFHHLARKPSTTFSILLKSTTITFLLNLAWVAFSNNWSPSLSGSGTPLSDWNLAHLQMLLTHPRLLQRILVQFMKSSFLILWALTSVFVAVHTLAKIFKTCMDGNMDYIRSCLREDLADISAYYQADSSSKSQFWVACLASHPQLVLGCVALDDNAAHVEQLKKKHLEQGESEESFKMPDPESSELRRMSVHPDYRRLGIGKRMLQTLKAHAVEKGFKRVTLSTTMFQVEAIAGYEQFGFEEKRRLTLYGLFSIWFAELDLTKEAQARK